MPGLPLRLPDSLHDTIVARAGKEGVSVNQFLVYALTQLTALDRLKNERELYDELRQRSPTAQAEAAPGELLMVREPEPADYRAGQAKAGEEP